MADDELTNIVIDHGSETFKAGLAGEDSPRVVFPPLLGVPKSKVMIGIPQKLEYVGDEAMSKRGVLRLSYPYSGGIINDWDGMEKLWHYTFFNQIRVDPSEHRVLLTTATSSPSYQKERMCETFFESFEARGLCLLHRAEAVAYAHGLSSALVVLLGHSGTSVAAVAHNRLVKASAVHSDLGGHALNLHLRELMLTKGMVFTTSAEMEILKDFKRFCEVSQNYDKTMQDFKEGRGQGKTYELPSGNIIELEDAVFSCPEAYFKPDLAKSDSVSLPDLIVKSFGKCDEETKKELHRRCIISGGSSLFKGLQSRLNSETSRILPKKDTLTIRQSAEAKYDAWIGGSILASLNTFPQIVLTRQEYLEHGAVQILAKGV